jgi:hypothetical protein
MFNKADQAATNLEQARDLRAAGATFRAVGRRLGLTSAQLGLIRRTLKREKAGRTRLHKADSQATDRDLTIGRSALPAGLRQTLAGAGFRTLGDIADRLADPDRPGLETLAGIGPHRARLVMRLLDSFDLLPGPDDLKAAIEDIFPEFGDGC